MSDTGNHRIQYYQKGEEVRALNLSVEFPIGTCLTSDSRLIIIDWKGAKMLRNGKISAPVKGSRIAKIYKGTGCCFSFAFTLYFKISKLELGRGDAKGKNSAWDPNAVESRLLENNGQDLRYRNGLP